MQETFDIGGDLTVNRLGFGAMRLCADGIIGAPDDEANARVVVERALELGVDFIDTADSYGPGTSERLLREAGAPAEAVVATKAGLLREAGGDWLPHGEPDYIRNQALVSRDRLGVDTIDLYQFHRPDPDADHAVEAVVQPSERIRFSYESGELVEQDRERIETDEPELFACACGVRGMTREEAREHLTAVRE